MNINRHNYEEFFMLYADNELTAEERKDVELFVEQNTDLAEELDLLKQLQFKPDAGLVFMDKESLFRNEEEHETINITNYEEFFVLYADNELSTAQQSSVEKFVYKNPAVQAEFELIQATKLEADNNIVYAHKEELYRREKDEKVIPFFISIRAWKWAAAAVLILMAGLIWMNQTGTNKLPESIAVVETKEETKALPQTITPKITEEEKVATADTKKESKLPEVNLKNANTASNNSVAKKVETNSKKENKEATLAEENEAIEAKKDLVALQHMKPEKNTAITNPESRISTNKNLTSSIQHKDPIIDQPVYINTNNDDIQFADLNEDKNEDVVYVSNTAVRKQNPLRGIFRKASRFVERTTNAKPSDGSGILIGNLSIALR